MSAAPARAVVQVWTAPEALADDPQVAARIRALLSEDERVRQERLRADTPRRLDLVARGLQRSVLSSLEPGIAAADWRFVRDASGRPSLAPPFDRTGLNFNLAHTNGLVVMAVGRVARLGVDVERADKPVRLEVARRYFSPAESAALFALPPPQQPGRFVRLWTLKESYLKATGAGIAGGLASMTFTFDAAGTVVFSRADDPCASRWLFSEFEPPGYLLALACLAAGGEAVPDVRLRGQFAV